MPYPHTPCKNGDQNIPFDRGYLLRGKRVAAKERDFNCESIRCRPKPSKRPTRIHPADLCASRFCEGMLHACVPPTQMAMEGVWNGWRASVQTPQHGIAAVRARAFYWAAFS